MHQHQARLHGVEVHLDPAFGLGTDTTIGHDQGLAIWQPCHFMRADAVGGDLAGMYQAFTFEAVHA
ncbi:hypothetical protein D3C81_1849820 [compost metagenome]